MLSGYCTPHHLGLELTAHKRLYHGKAGNRDGLIILTPDVGVYDRIFEDTPGGVLLDASRVW
jgi:hypothetical protein